MYQVFFKKFGSFNPVFVLYAYIQVHFPKNLLKVFFFVQPSIILKKLDALPKKYFLVKKYDPLPLTKKITWHKEYYGGESGSSLTWNFVEEIYADFP